MRSSHFGDDFRLTLITDDPRLAAEGDRAGVNRIGVDLEHLGKAERQAGHDTRISRHGWSDLRAVGRAIERAELFVRLNRVHPETHSEVETALGFGARVLMLPCFDRPDEVETFSAAVRGRAAVVILLERAPAVMRIDRILSVRGVDEVMIGLNDLHLEFRAANHFEMLASPLVDFVASQVRARGLPLSIGGVGRVDDPRLPIPSDLVLAQYPRLDATGAWIARSFLNGLPPPLRLAEAIRRLRGRLDDWSASSPDTLEGARDRLAQAATHWGNASASYI